MYNHARTLLLNIDGNAAVDDGFPCEELISRDFRELALPTYIKTLRQRLFGANPDRQMLCYRGRQLMTLLHASELEEYVLALDPRVTYTDDLTYGLAAPDFFLPQVTNHGGVGELSVVGGPAAPDATGKVAYEYDVDVLLDSTVEVKRVRPYTATEIYDLALTDGLSEATPLAGCGYSFRINTISPSAHWRVQGYLRPQWSLGEIAEALRRAGEPALLQLFGLGKEEPWQTFRNLWEDHDELALSLGGLLLAMIYRCEEIRRG